MEIENNATPTNNTPNFPHWAPVAGVTFGGITFVFFMALVIMSLFDKALPPTSTSKFLIISILSLGVALALAFVGGDASAKGILPISYLNSKPIEFSVAGGIAVFVVVFFIGNATYTIDPPRENGIQVEFAYLNIITSGVPPGTNVIVYDENGEMIASSTTGIDDTILRMRIDKKYIGREITVRMSAIGYTAFTKRLKLLEESTIEFEELTNDFSL